MQSTECQSYLNQSKVDICATLWCIYNLSGVYKDVASKPKKKDSDPMTMNFLLHKDRKENKENATAQKQECGCPSLQPSLRSHTHAFFPDLPIDSKLLINN